MLFGRAVAALVGNAQKVFAYVPGASGSAAAFHVYGETPPAQSGATTADTNIFDGFYCFILNKAAGAAAGRAQQLGPPAPAFHHLVDPSTPAVNEVVVFEDLVSATITALACETVFGFHEHITLGVVNTLVGVGFRAGADHIWHAFVNDCPTDVAPVTVRRDTVLAPLSTSFHRLSLIIDGRSKTIFWYIDDVLVDSWTPGAPLDQMRPLSPKCMWSLTYPINGAGSIRMHAGGLPQLRIMSQVT